jgi:predicted hydrocarbon binding protein
MFRMSYNYGSGVHSGSYTGSQAASRAESKATSLESQVKRLQADLARSFMISEALWELLRDRAKLTEKDLHKKLYEIDMRDGELDGQNKRKAQKCPECKHMVSSRHPACIYCGKVMDDSVFAI